jgi:hypothetical protein
MCSDFMPLTVEGLPANGQAARSPSCGGKLSAGSQPVIDLGLEGLRLSIVGFKFVGPAVSCFCSYEDM